MIPIYLANKFAWDYIYIIPGKYNFKYTMQEENTYQTKQKLFPTKLSKKTYIGYKEGSWWCKDNSKIKRTEQKGKHQYREAMYREWLKGKKPKEKLCGQGVTWPA